MFKRNCPEYDHLAKIFEVILGESPQQARKLCLDWRRYRNTAMGLWRQAATISLKESVQRAEQITMQDEDVLHYFLNSHRQGIVLLTIHMGDYLHSILKILKLAPSRKIIILRRKTWSEIEESSLKKLELIGHTVEIVRHGSRASRMIAKGLREGAIAVLLYDLPYGWGETQAVKMFNHQLHWVRGPLQLALLGRASVLPFFTFNTADGWVCHLEAVKDFRHSKPGSDHEAILSKEIQAMASLAERQIRCHVAQWDHWNLMHDMVLGGQRE
ncbi:MAG: hypothetical protein V7708_03810 [Oceanicoccus sp.]